MDSDLTNHLRKGLDLGKPGQLDDKKGPDMGPQVLRGSKTTLSNTPWPASSVSKAGHQEPGGQDIGGPDIVEAATVALWIERTQVEDQPVHPWSAKAQNLPHGTHQPLWPES
jgi:hypothetical protein